MSIEAKRASKKRSRQEDGTSRKRARRAATDDDGDLDLDARLNRAFERMDSQLLADLIAQRTARFARDLSPVELSDLYISASAIKDTKSWGSSRSLESLPDFLEAFSEDAKKLVEAPEANGAPHSIIVAAAGLRAADVVRSVRKFQNQGNTVAKLFAKHMKLEEQVSFLGKSRTGIAVGTPQRLIDLLDNGALSVAGLRRVVVDASHIDVKKRGVMDMRETLMPLVKLLTRDELRTKYSDAEQRIDLMFY